MLQSLKNVFFSETTTTTTTSTTTPVSNSAIKRYIGNINDYKNANYFNYYRILENKYDYLRDTFGLKTFSNNETFKLIDFTIDSEMNNTCITSIWNQKYSNNSSIPVEGIYKIPLAPYSVISGFTVEYQDKVFIGKIKSKEKAQNQYSDSIASGGQAFLAEKTQDGQFSFRIGNLPPNENVTIHLTIISGVCPHLSSLQNCFHRFLFPNYSFNFQFNLNIKLTLPIKTIELLYYPNREIKFKENSNNKEATLTFSSKNGIDSDIVCIVEPENDIERPQSIIEHSKLNNTYAVSVNFTPSFSHLTSDDVNQKSEFIFLIDCSGSMSGEPIKKAKRALEIIIRSLNENCKFNIYCFGSRFTKAFDNSKMYNDETLAQISGYVEKIDADLGGTELLPPIRDILSTESDFEYPRQLFILTDGEVSERDSLINYVATESNNTRIFTYGIGNSVDTELVIGLSKACKGYYEMIKDNSNFEEQVMKLVSIAFEPTLSNIKVDWGTELQIEQGPTKIRPLYSGETLIVYALLKDNKIPQSTVQVSLIGDGPTGSKLEFPITLDFSKTIDYENNSVHTLAAFNIIKDLEEVERKGNHSNNRDRIEELGKSYGLISKYTSYIVTAASEQVTEETMKTLNIIQTPTTTTTTSHSNRRREEADHTMNQTLLKNCAVVDDLFESCEMLSETSIKFECNRVYKKIPSSLSKIFSFFSSLSTSSSVRSEVVSNFDNDIESEEKKNNSINNNSDSLLKLIKLQKANGSWSSPFSEFKIDLSKKPSNIDSDDIWITLIVINKILNDYPTQQSQYDLVIQKASKWVKQQLTRLNIPNQYGSLLATSKLHI
ncbi:type A von Willebrand factor domain-containing protein [Dictyostelium discoideum AX4]|uniref:von Willebrand factor A domain-containing protein DDB_G0285981 n=1 Tax=Dictyostelium discoideum TaxID=44689 RepID=Y5981_DICDI|nr:type A von Willebrand factor domain-containing protein [Dictyostelium discoideum AX4]Q54MG1.1 RecName: Full=von Willebrand factor A domain-containing protein DDB_G0285981 [Dictyostelium discoideum]EAL64449.1 type A von Willebrand factor domain-containing protein [Dictyostelium discoideum AX4]|eukprot:XP_637953.1 type A von Willebrand factor domain-containing protein [Dictyostelium discoideum AX4]